LLTNSLTTNSTSSAMCVIRHSPQAARTSSRASAPADRLAGRLRACRRAAGRAAAAASAARSIDVDRHGPVDRHPMQFGPHRIVRCAHHYRAAWPPGRGVGERGEDGQRERVGHPRRAQIHQEC
jgi:hypothetical protein